MRHLFVALACLLASASVCYAQQGRIVDAATGIGVAGATVTIGDRVVATGADGRVPSRGANSRDAGTGAGYRAATMSAAAFRQASSILRITSFRPKALYLSFYGIGSQAIRDAAFKLIRDAQLNAVVIDVKGDRGLIAYRSAISLAQVAGAQRIITIPDLPALLQSLHASGIYAIARIVAFKDDPLATARPDLAVKLHDGRLFHDRENLGWTDPTLKEVRDYNTGIAVEAAWAGFDEISLTISAFRTRGVGSVSRSPRQRRAGWRRSKASCRSTPPACAIQCLPVRRHLRLRLLELKRYRNRSATRAFSGLVESEWVFRNGVDM